MADSGVGRSKIAAGHYGPHLPRRCHRALSSLRRGVGREQRPDLLPVRIDASPTGAHAVSDRRAEQAREVRRKSARELSLPVAEKSDSQEICFVPNNDYAAFLRSLSARAGRVRAALARPRFISTEGRTLGGHSGVHHFTVGQRRGLGVSAPEPLYVIATEPATQRVIVGRNEELLRSTLIAREVNWISWPGLAAPARAEVKIRNKHLPAAATLHPGAREGCVEVRFDEPCSGWPSPPGRWPRCSISATWC